MKEINIVSRADNGNHVLRCLWCWRRRSCEADGCRVSAPLELLDAKIGMPRRTSITSTPVHIAK